MNFARAVYEKVSDLKYDPWRTPDAFGPFDNTWEWKEGTYKKLFTNIADAVPPDSLKDGKLNLLVIGPHSHGKSSFINTVASLSAKVKTTVANSGTGGESETVTTVFRHLDLPGDFKCFRLCDVPGLPTLDSADISVVNLKLAIDGHIKPGYEFDDKAPITDADKTYYISEPTTENKMHGVIIVFDITETYEIHIRHRNSLGSITKKLHKMNIPISVVLTKADLLDPLVRENIEKIYHSKRVLTAVQNTSTTLGVPIQNIHPVVNFEDNNKFEWKNGLPTLVAVRACLSMASNHLLSKGNDAKKKPTNTKETNENKEDDNNK